MAGGGKDFLSNNNPYAAAANASQGGTAPTSNPFVQSGMAAMLMAQRQPQMGGGAPMHHPMMGAPGGLPQMPMQPAPNPFGGGFQQGAQQQGMTPQSVNQALAQRSGLFGNF